MLASLSLSSLHSAAGSSVVTFHKSGSSPLHSFKLVDVGGCVWVRDCACIFQDGSQVQGSCRSGP